MRRDMAAARYVLPGAAEHDLRLHLNENLFGPAPACVRAVRDLSGESLARYGAASGEALVAALGDRFGLDTAAVGIGEGAAGIMRAMFSAVLTAGDAVVGPAPGWGYYRALAALSGARYRQYPMVDTGTGFGLDVESLLEVARDPDVRLVVLNTPHMPSGSAVPAPVVERIADVLDDRIILVDETYWGFRPEEDDPAPFLARSRNVVLVRSFSKLYGLASARVGFRLSNPSLEQRLSVADSPFGISHPAQVMAVAALSESAYYQDLAQRVRQITAEFASTVRQRTAMHVYDTDANFLLLRVDPEATGGISAGEVVAGLAARAIQVRHCAGYGLGDHLRIGVGTAQQMSRVLLELVDICAHP